MYLKSKLVWLVSSALSCRRQFMQIAEPRNFSIFLLCFKSWLFWLHFDCCLFTFIYIFGFVGSEAVDPFQRVFRWLFNWFFLFRNFRSSFSVIEDHVNLPKGRRAWLTFNYRFPGRQNGLFVVVVVGKSGRSTFSIEKLHWCTLKSFNERIFPVFITRTYFSVNLLSVFSIYWSKLKRNEYKYRKHGNSSREEEWNEF